MKLTDTMPFAAELLGPPHHQSYLRPGAVATAGDVTIDAAWSVTADTTVPLLVTARDHLLGFLSISLGVTLGGGGHTIRLVADPALAGGPETHRIRVAADGIEVRGSDAVGVLQGVFRLEARLKERGGAFLAAGEETRTPAFRQRIHRSPLSPFYVEELTGFDGAPLDARWLSPGMAYPGFAEEDAGPDRYYHDHLLLKMAEHGFNGIWLRGALKLFAKVAPFPECGLDADRILGRLRHLCDRAARHGLRVFLYMNEPMGMRDDDPFWEAHPQVRGSASPFKPMRHLCTSTPEVKEYLREGTRYVFDQVPDLAGVALITASEFPSHCYVHLNRPSDPDELAAQVAAGRLCPRCAPRTPQEVIGEVVTLIAEGAQAANPAAEVIAWNWSWSAYEPDPQRGVLEQLPPSAIVMGDYERGEPTSACGFDYRNDEYSIKVVGPSERFRGLAEYVQQQQRPVYARIQIGTTHENPNVPYLPALHKIGEKYLSLRAAGVTGMMTCWNFGNMPSLGTAVAGEFTFDPPPASVDEGLLRLATREFGPAAELAVAGWRKISAAQDKFPGSIPVMYHGPISRAPAFGLQFDRIDKPFPNSWLLDADIRGDLLDNWTAPFGPAKVSECLRATAAEWGEGCALLQQALALVSGDDQVRLRREWGVAEMCRIAMVCSANVTDFLLLRNEYLATTDASRKAVLLDQIEALARDHRAAALAAIPLCDADPRLGWHGEAYGYMYHRELIAANVAALDELLGVRLPAERQAL